MCAADLSLASPPEPPARLRGCAAALVSRAPASPASAVDPVVQLLRRGDHGCPVRGGVGLLTDQVEVIAIGEGDVHARARLGLGPPKPMAPGIPATRKVTTPTPPLFDALNMLSVFASSARAPGLERNCSTMDIPAPAALSRFSLAAARKPIRFNLAVSEDIVWPGASCSPLSHCWMLVATVGLPAALKPVGISLVVSKRWASAGCGADDDAGAVVTTEFVVDVL